MKTPEIIPRLKELEIKGLISKDDEGYSLAPVGHILLKDLKALLGKARTLDNSPEFWMTHDLSGIPEFLLDRLQDLKDCEVVQIEKNKMFVSDFRFVKYVSEARYFKGMAHVFIPSWIALFSNLASQGIPIEIIITSEIFQEIKNTYYSELESYLKNGARLYISNEPQTVSYASTGEFISLSLNYLTGIYDHRSNFQGTDKEAVGWIEDFFEYSKIDTVEIKTIESMITQESIIAELL